MAQNWIYVEYIAIQYQYLCITVVKLERESEKVGLPIVILDVSPTISLSETLLENLSNAFNRYSYFLHIINTLYNKNSIDHSYMCHLPNYVI